MKESFQKVLYVFMWVQVLSVLSLSAQVQELWRTGLTNSGIPLKAYVFRAAFVDAAGNTIVGGGISGALSVTGGFVVKFDPQGNKVWETDIGTNSSGGLDALEGDAQGNVFATVPINVDTVESGVALIKLSPEGDELWRVVEPAPDLSPNSHNSAVKVDAAGNAFMTTLVMRDLAPDKKVLEQIVAKVDANGRTLWRITLPGYSYFMPEDFSFSRLALNRAGSISVAGMYTGEPISERVNDPRGFVATLNADGEIEWWSDEARGEKRLGFYSSVLVNEKGIVAAAGTGYGASFFSQKGKPIHTQPDGDRMLQVTDKGGFLFTCRGYLCAVNSTGSHELWQFAHMFSNLFGVVPSATGWIAAGSRGVLSPLGFVGIDENGNELWRSEFPDYRFSNVATFGFHGALLRAPDGTLRIVAPVSSFGPFSLGGIVVAAFSSP